MTTRAINALDVVTLENTDHVVVSDVSGGGAGKRVLAGRMLPDYGMIYGEPAGLAGGIAVADLGAGIIATGSVSDFYTGASGVERGITATPASGKLVPSRTGKYRVRYTVVGVFAQTAGTMGSCLMQVYATYNGVKVPGSLSGVSVGDGTGAAPDSDGVGVMICGEAIANITTAGQDLVLVFAPVKTAGTMTAVLMLPFSITLTMERIDD